MDIHLGYKVIYSMRIILMTVAHHKANNKQQQQTTMTSKQIVRVQNVVEQRWLPGNPRQS